MNLVKGPAGVDHRKGLPKLVKQLVTDLVANGELAEEDKFDVMCNITPITSDLHLEAQMSKGQAAIETLLFTYADLATDVLMIAQYYADGRATVATVMLAVLVCSLVVQAFTTHALGQGGWEEGGGVCTRKVVAWPHSTFYPLSRHSRTHVHTPLHTRAQARP